MELLGILAKKAGKVASKMNLAPVFYTLAQVQFNPVTQMSDYVVRLQEKLRRKGFPDFRPEHHFGLVIRSLDESQPNIQQQQQMRWSFANTKRTEGFLLFSNTLIFHTTAYDTFEDFLEKMMNGVELVNKIVELDYVERIGLRYLDAIVAKDNDQLQQYLHPSLMGLSENLGGSTIHSFTETITAIRANTLVARSFVNQSGLAISPDLLPLQLDLQQRFREIAGQNIVLDTDCFTSDRSDFDIVDIEDKLKSAHEVLKDAFRVSVTDYAMEKWA
jgi:uncharacterized protein (TIGR04255 family)